MASGRELRGSKTADNLMAAFTRESQAGRRYLYFAQQADKEGYNDVAAVFRAAADHENAHAEAALALLEAAGDPETGEPFGPTADNLRAAIHGAESEAVEAYPEMAAAARAEGFEAIARLFENLGRSEDTHARRFRRLLNTLDEGV